MARTRSKDYEQKKEFIHNQAVELFAERGFANSSLSLLAKRCQSSKAWVYHYYENKEAILFDIFERHTRLLVETVRKVVKNGHKPEEQLKQVLHSYMNIYSTSQAKHLVLLHDINRLQGKQKEIIVNRERKIVELLAELIERVNPAVLSAHPEYRKPIAMSLMGMLNWTFTWLRPDGPISYEQYSDLAGQIFLTGIKTIGK